MNVFFLLGLLVLALALFGLRALGRASAEQVAGLTRQAVVGVALFTGAVAMARGQIPLALALAGFALFVAVGNGFRSPFTLGGKRVRGGIVELEFDDCGVRDGLVLSGRFAGARLSEMSKSDCLAFHVQCSADHPQALLALETYFDRRFPGWRAAAEDDADPGSGWSGGARNAGGFGEMSEEEAYETLGLRWGASADQIVRAHRSLMKEHHPDHGGTTDGAARLNQAKDRLLRRHG